MAMNKELMTVSLTNFLTSLHENPTSEDIVKIRKYAEGFSQWVIESIQTAEVIVSPGQTVVTAGSPTSQTGTTTTPGSGVVI